MDLPTLNKNAWSDHGVKIVCKSVKIVHRLALQIGPAQGILLQRSYAVCIAAVSVSLVSHLAHTSAVCAALFAFPNPDHIGAADCADS